MFLNFLDLPVLASVTLIETPAFKKDNSWILLCILSVSKFTEVKILSEGIKVISVPVSLDALTFFSFATALPSLYF